MLRLTVFAVTSHKWIPAAMDGRVAKPPRQRPLWGWMSPAGLRNTCSLNLCYIPASLATSDTSARQLHLPGFCSWMNWFCLVPVFNRRRVCVAQSPLHLAREVRLRLDAGVTVLTWTQTGVAVQVQKLCRKVPGSARAALHSVRAQVTQTHSIFLWSGIQAHRQHRICKAHLRGEVLFVLPSIIQHICIIPFCLMTWSLYLRWLFFFNGIYFFLWLKYHINLIFLFYTGFQLVRNAADLFSTSIIPVNLSLQTLFSQKGNKGRERISVHLFCPKLGITEECENKTKTLQSHKPTHAWIESYFAWTSSPIPHRITANSLVPFLQLKILIGNKLLHEPHRWCTT